MPRFKITIQYDGSAYCGWQVQNNGNSIQAELEKVLFKLSKGAKINVIGAGRTDSGVHAIEQVAHFDWNTQISNSEIVSAFNGNLPVDIRVNTCAIVSFDFHARYSAIKRQYLYKCKKNPHVFERNYIWNTSELEIQQLNDLAELLLGVHDFTSFSKANPEIENKICRVFLSEWSIDGSILNYRVAANRFLHHMVRFLVGTMVEVTRGNMTHKEFISLINEPREKVKIYRAPAHGLYLEKVEYNGADNY